MPEQSLLTDVFSHKAHHSLLAFRNNGQHFSTMIGGHFK